MVVPESCSVRAYRRSFSKLLLRAGFKRSFQAARHCLWSQADLGLSSASAVC